MTTCRSGWDTAALEYRQAEDPRAGNGKHSMKMPNADRAFVDIDKLTQYCLSPSHPRGRHKARMFESALGITAADADMLRDALLAAATDDCVPGEVDEYGRRYVIDFEMSGPHGDATVRSAWIVRDGEDFPRFVSCYVL